MAETESYRKGAEVRRQIGMDVEAERRRWEGLDPEFGPAVHTYLTEACFGDVWARPGLDLRTRRLLTIAMLAAMGRERQLRGHLAGALKQGISREEVLETLLQVIPYAGFPAGLTGLELFREISGAGR